LRQETKIQPSGVAARGENQGGPSTKGGWKRGKSRTPSFEVNYAKEVSEKKTVLTLQRSVGKDRGNY